MTNNANIQVGIESITGVAIAPNLATFVAVSGKTVHVYHANDQSHIGVFPEQTGTMQAFSYAPDSQTLLYFDESGGLYSTRFKDFVPDWQRLYRYKDEFQHAAFSPYAPNLLRARGTEVLLTYADDNPGQTYRVLEHYEPIDRISYSPDGDWLCCWGKTRLAIHKVEIGASRYRIFKIVSVFPQTCIAWYGDTLLAVASRDGGVSIMRYANIWDEDYRHFHVDGEVRAVGFLSESYILVASDTLLRCYDIDGKPMGEGDPVPAPVSCVEVRRFTALDKEYFFALAGCEDGSLMIRQS